MLDYQRSLTSQIEGYNSNLMAKKEQLEATCADIQKLVNDCHFAKLIQQRDSLTEELYRAIDEDLQCQLLSIPVVIHTG